MTTDTFEDELRSLLHNTADAEGSAYIDVDPGAVVFHGRRVVRRRRIATGAAAAAAVLVIGVGGAVVVDGVGQDRATDPVPGGPSTGLGRGSVSVTLDLGGEVGGLPAPGPNSPASVRVAVDERALTWAVTVVDGEGRTKSVPVATLPANPRFSTYADVGGDSGLVVGVMPAAATDIVAVWLTDSEESSFSSSPVPGTDRKVFAVRYSGTPDPDVPGETTFGGFDWTDGENVFTSAGTSVRSARVGDAVAFIDEAQGLFGMFGPRATASKRLNDTPKGKLPGVMAGHVPLGSTTIQTTVLVLLPAGATSVDVRPSPGATITSVDTVPGGSIGQTMVLVRLTAPDTTPGTGVERVRWTDPDGTPGSGTVG